MRAVAVLGLVVVMAVAGLLGGGVAVANPVAAAPVAAPAPVAPALPAGPTIVAGTPCLSTARACVERSSNRAWLIRGGVVEYGPVPITHGRKGYRTPPGTFRVSFKNRHHVSSIYGAPMPNSVFFNGGIAFHQGSLKEKSHGCIHLSRTAARTFFGALGRGDVVQVV
jgi:L,D-transpeptidase catalytic domain